MQFVYSVTELNFIQFVVLVVAWLIGCWLIGRKH